MARFTTIVAVIADESTELVNAVAAEATNVGAVTLDSMDAGLDERQRRVAALRAAERRRSVYTLIDFDVMQPVVDEWSARLTGATDELDVEAGRVVRTDLPEYVLVADDMADESVHWYHGLLRSYAPRRVMTTTATPAAIIGALSHLRSDRAFPATDVIASAALSYVPTSPTLE